MKLTFDNVFENREYFQNLCHKNGACREQYRRLIRVKTKKAFMKVIYDNFGWINFKIEEFEPKFEYARGFCNGFAAAGFYGKVADNKLGFLKTDGTWLVKPQFNYVYDFSCGLALVLLDGKYGYIKEDGSYLIKPELLTASCFNNGHARIYKDGKLGTIDTSGKITWEKP